MLESHSLKNIPMRTLVIFLSLITCLAGIPANAQSFTGADKTPLIFEKIQNSVQVPEIMKGSVSTERVRVVFTIDENGRAHVVDVNTARPDLKAPVTKQFEAIDFSATADGSGQMYSIWLNFKVM
jgi:hypothetical protein